MDVFTESGGIKEDMHAFNLFPIQMTSVIIPVQSIYATSISHGETHTFICTMEPTKVKVYDISDRSAVRCVDTHFPGEDSILMHPSMKIAALKGLPSFNSVRNLDRLRIVYFEEKEEFAYCDIPHKIRYWRWIQGLTLGLASDSYVYMLSLGETLNLIQVLDISNTHLKVIDYQCDPSVNWLALTFSESCESHSSSHLGEGSKTMVIYSVQSKSHLNLNFVSPVCFDPSSVEGCALLIGAELLGSSLILRYLTITNQGGTVNQPLFVDIVQLQKDVHEQNILTDSVFALKYCGRYSWVYVVTKNGLVLVFDVKQATLVHISRIDPLSLMSELSLEGDFCAVSTLGKVFIVGINKQNIVPHIGFVRKAWVLASELASRTNLPGAESLFEHQFQCLLDSGKYEEAAICAANSPQDSLRTHVHLRRLLLFCSDPGRIPVKRYFDVLEKYRKEISKDEYEVYCNHYVGSRTPVRGLLALNRFKCTEDLGDYIKGVDLDVATKIYMKAEASKKVIDIFARQNDIEGIFIYCCLAGFYDYFYILETLLQTRSKDAVTFARILKKRFSIESICRFLIKNGYEHEAEELREE
ncbi:OLC1v1019440C1 [Oldenlandia corymbosa var. corymbosa]|uniref:OLC1v1019440C1 n=1 Tax=Oldenlandia corymbosa var. corymbosa TaxID=529605 RepID=A0AAV1EE27_OLDCO|nr:OLC1v1019440C1 [Oldenlandia corymbosa var. corymbosa]